MASSLPLKTSSAPRDRVKQNENGITQHSVLVGPVQPPVHSSSQHSVSIGPKHCPFTRLHRSWQFWRVT